MIYTTDLHVDSSVNFVMDDYYKITPHKYFIEKLSAKSRNCEKIEQNAEIAYAEIEQIE